MSRRPRRNHSAAFKAKVALAAVRGEKTLADLAWMRRMGIEVVEEAMARYGAPGIFNTDQGSQFTSSAFTGLLQRHGIRISRDGKGCWRDNVFVERLWKSVKYEEVYLHAYPSVFEARAGLARYFTFYNARRPHSSLDRKTPDSLYFPSQSLPEAA